MRPATVAALTVLLAATICGADAPQMISYQGVLSDAEGQILPDGSYDITFAIYDVDTGDEPLWVETQTLPVAGGIFDAMLGAVVPLDLPFDVAYWLGVAVGPDPELTPRTALASSPYAYSAAYAAASGDDGDWAMDGSNVYRRGGRVGIGVANPLNKLHVDGTVRTEGFRMEPGAADGRVLTSDDSGVGTWQRAAANGLVEVDSASFEVAPSTTVTGLDPDKEYLLKIRVKHISSEARYFVRVNGDAGFNYQYTVRWTTDDGVSGSTGSGGSGMSADHGMLSPAGADGIGILEPERWSGDLHISTAFDESNWTYIRQETLWDFSQHSPAPYCADVSGVIRYHGSAPLSSIEISPTIAGDMTGEWVLYEYQ